MLPVIYGHVFMGVSAAAAALAVSSESKLIRWAAVGVAFWAGVGHGTYLVLNKLLEVLARLALEQIAR